MPTNKYFACPFCKERFTREDMIVHISRKHDEELPEGFTPLRAAFHAVNRKDFNYRRPCRICKKPTAWDENKGRYNFLCDNPNCKKAWIENMKNTMGDKYGAYRPTATAEGLEKMLAHRKISGTYKFSSGGEVPYTGSYEKKCLEFMDKVLDIKVEDIEVPGPVIKYPYRGSEHIYIPDIYYRPYNLIIEVKDGGSNPNTHPGYEEVRAKKIAKENYVIKHTEYNYLRQTDNDFSQLLGVFADLKLHLNNDDKSRVIHVHETALGEHMGMAAINPMVGFIPGRDVVIANNTKRQTFGIANSPKFEKIVTINNLGQLGLDTADNFGTKEDVKLYVKKDIYPKIEKDIEKFMDREITQEAFYELIFGHPMYTKDQILFEDVIDYSKLEYDMENFTIEATLNTIFGEDEESFCEGFEEFKSTFLNEEDVKYNYDAFSRGTSDVLFITGPASFGRAADFSGIAEQFGADIIHLDDVQKHYQYSDKTLKKKHKLIYQYFTETDKGIEYRKKKKKDIEVNLYETVPNFILYFLDNKEKDKRYIVEGTQIIDLLAANRLDIDLLKKYSVLLKGSSYLQTQIQTMKSDMNNDSEEKAFELLSNYIDAITNEVKKITHGNFSKSLKKKDEDNRSVMDVIKDAFRESVEISSPSIKSPEELIHWMKRNLHYSNISKIKTWQEVLDSKSGCCHDFVMFEKHFFDKFTHTLGTRYNTLFCMEFNEGKEGVGGRTHSFIYWWDTEDKFGKPLPESIPKHYYWFEVAWESQQGIRGPYSSIEDLKKDIEKKMLSESKCDFVEFAPFRGKPGMSLQELVDACMNESVNEASNNLNDAFRESTYINEGTHKTNVFRNIYHVSTENLDGKILHPRIPNNKLTEHDLEENKTPRVCFCKSIDKCLMALSDNLKDKEFYVHIPADETEYQDVSKHQVADAKVTKEKWVLCDVKLICIGKIKVHEAKDKAYMYNFKDVNKEVVKKMEMDPKAYLHKWNWEWVEKYDNKSINEATDKIYYGLTDEEAKNKSLEYKGSKDFTHKGINTSLSGLKKFITDNGLQDTITKYTILNKNDFDIDDSVYPDSKYDMIAAKMPFTININNIHSLNETWTEEEVDMTEDYIEYTDYNYNLDKWGNDSNILYITGLTGSGKTYTANKIFEEGGCELVSLDNISFYYMSSHNYPHMKNKIRATLTEQCPEALEFLDTHDYALQQKYRDTIFIQKEFCNWFDKYNNSNKKYILEGDLLFYVHPVTWYTDKPVIVKFNEFADICRRRASRGIRGSHSSEIAEKEAQLQIKNKALKEHYDKIAADIRILSEATNKSDSSLPSVSKPWFITSDDGVDNACVSINGYDKPFRARSSMLIVKLGDDGKWQVFLSKDNEVNHEYHAPGGGWNKGESAEDAAKREAKEEVYMNVTNVKPEGFLIEYHDEVQPWVKDHVKDSKDWWYGYYSAIFVGQYDSKFTGKVEDIDKDQMANSAKWYKFEDIKENLTPKEYVDAIENYIREVDTPLDEDVFYCTEDDTIDLTGPVPTMPIDEITEEDLKKNMALSPVFVVLSFNGSVVGKVIKGYGKDLGWEYSHSSISLTPSLSTLYSFNITKSTDEEGHKHKYNGLAIEHFRDFRDNPKCKIKVIAILVDRETKSKIKQAIQYYIDNIDKTKYATKSLGKALLGTGANVQNYGNMTLFCSQFVDSVLKQANIDIGGKGSSINVHPSELGQFKDKNNYFTIYEGKASGYNEDEVNDKIIYMKQTMTHKELNAITDKSNTVNKDDHTVENRAKEFVQRKVDKFKANHSKNKETPEPLDGPLAVEGGAR